jgi:transcriptional regulator CBF1
VGTSAEGQSCPFIHFIFDLVMLLSLFI